MPRQRSSKGVSIVLRKGKTYVYGPGVDVVLKDSIWMIRVNPKLLPPGFRRTDRKKLFVGRKCIGWAYQAYTGIPIDEYRRKCEYLSDVWANYICERTGIGCRERKRGYFAVCIKNTIFIVVVGKTEQGNYDCLVYTKHNSDYIGNFIISPTFETIQNRLGDMRYARKFYTVIGYVSGCLLTSAVSNISSEMKIDH